jgi:hypothetical protein
MRRGRIRLRSHWCRSKERSSGLGRLNPWTQAGTGDTNLVGWGLGTGASLLWTVGCNTIRLERAI